MGFRLNLKSNTESFSLERESIVNVKYISDTADETNARSTDVNVGLEIEGKILSPINGNESEDNTKKILLWSLINAEEQSAYREAILEIILAGNVVRKFTYPNAFIVDYIEEYDEKEGNGKFKLKLKQKKDKIKDILIEGGYNV